MSTRSSLLFTNACHIYKDMAYQHTTEQSIGEYVLVIDVNYEYVENEDGCNDSIVVEWDSDFAKMVIFMIKTCGSDAIEDFCKGAAND